MKLFVLLLVALLNGTPAVSGGDPSNAKGPWPRAHAHNDYEHKRPLLDALDHGFCSVEADIHLVDGQLLVAHNREQVRPDRTLRRLYLEPLRVRIEKNGGRVYPGGPTIVLLIDVKSDADPTYRVLRNALIDYASILTRFAPDRIETNAVTVVISGNRARDLMRAEPVRYAALDGRPEDLDHPVSESLIPLISESWSRLFQWRGVGEFPNDEQQRLRQLVERAHAQHRKVRFWGTPDVPAFWRVLLASQVDLLNADDLAGLSEFFRVGGHR